MHQGQAHEVSLEKKEYCDYSFDALAVKRNRHALLYNEIITTSEGADFKLSVDPIWLSDLNEQGWLVLGSYGAAQKYAAYLATSRAKKKIVSGNTGLILSSLALSFVGGVSVNQPLATMSEVSGLLRKEVNRLDALRPMVGYARYFGLTTE